jgi:hypothetical protein
LRRLDSVLKRADSSLLGVLNAILALMDDAVSKSR